MERREKKRNRKMVAMFWGGESIVFLAILVLLSTFGKDWLCLYTISNTIVFVMLTVLTIAILTFMIICCKEYIKTPSEGTLQIVGVANILLFLVALPLIETITEMFVRPCLGRLFEYLASNLLGFIITFILCVVGAIMCMFAYMETKIQAKTRRK